MTYKEDYSFLTVSKAKSCSAGNMCNCISEVFYFLFRHITLCCSELPVSLSFFSIRRDVLLPFRIYNK